MATAQNDDNQTVCFKLCEGDESINGIEKRLRELKVRNPKEIIPIGVDNCCTVRDKLQKIFPKADIKLDPFH